MPKEEPMIRVQDVKFRYDPEQPTYAVDGVSLNVRRGEFVAVLGANGCGKSTLLRIISGLAEYEDGIVERNGHKVEGPGPQCGNRKRACKQSEDSFIG